jgi:hypothetical protein
MTSPLQRTPTERRHPHRKENDDMPYVNVGHENSTDIEIYYEDHGNGQPIVP